MRNSLLAPRLPRVILLIGGSATIRRLEQELLERANALPRDANIRFVARWMPLPKGAFKLANLFVFHPPGS
jgi:hypothetical protein